jgi:hypothetical protein
LLMSALTISRQEQKMNRLGETKGERFGQYAKNRQALTLRGTFARPARRAYMRRAVGYLAQPQTPCLVRIRGEPVRWRYGKAAQ